MRKIMILILYSIFLIVGIFVSGIAIAIEVIEYKSGTPAGFRQFTTRNYAIDSVTIKAFLTLPDHVQGQVPAMVVVHGSGGVTDSREGEWARRLKEIGVAALVIDSFGPRGISETATDQSKLSFSVNVADALNALKALASDPRIDKNRIGIIGFSKGGSVALVTALEVVRKSIITDSLMFAIHVSLYPAGGGPQ